jgi:hypothetical protein
LTSLSCFTTVSSLSDAAAVRSFLRWLDFSSFFWKMRPSSLKFLMISLAVEFEIPSCFDAL